MDLCLDVIYIIFECLDLKTLVIMRKVCILYRNFIDQHEFIDRKLAKLPWSVNFHVNKGNYPHPIRFGDGIVSLGTKQSKLKLCEFCKQNECDTFHVNGIGFPIEIIRSGPTCSAKINMKRKSVDFHVYHDPLINLKMGDIPAVCDISFRHRRLKLSHTI